jgi:hypothetical protein
VDAIAERIAGGRSGRSTPQPAGYRIVAWSTDYKRWKQTEPGSAGEGMTHQLTAVSSEVLVALVAGNSFNY